MANTLSTVLTTAPKPPLDGQGTGQPLPPPPPGSTSSPPLAKHEAVFVQQAPPQPHMVVQMPPPQQQQQQAHVVLAAASPDYLFGLDNGFVPPPAVKVKDPTGDPPTVSKGNLHRRCGRNIPRAELAGAGPLQCFAS